MSRRDVHVCVLKELTQRTNCPLHKADDSGNLSHFLKKFLSDNIHQRGLTQAIGWN